MDTGSLLALALALAMDAFAVSLAAGGVIDPVTWRHCFRLGFHFGLFQALMPILGWLAGSRLASLIGRWDHWLAFVLLAALGGRMIWQAWSGEEETREAADPSRGLSLVLLSVATSIDALAVGLTLAVLGVAIWRPALVIGLVAALLSVTGVLIGRRVGVLLGSRVEVAGGIVLIGVGVKILVEHL